MSDNLSQHIDDLETLIKNEVNAYQQIYSKANDVGSLREKVRKGFAVYPLNVFQVSYNRLGQVKLEVEKVPYWPRLLSSGAPGRIQAANADSFVNITVGKSSSEKVELILDVDVEPEWIKGNKLALFIRPDDRSFKEMERAITLLKDKDQKDFRELFQIAYGLKFQSVEVSPFAHEKLNSSQENAVKKIIGDNKLLVIHGPPGTGKTTTLTQGILALIKTNKRILVATPSNTAADHITNQLLKLTQKVVRVGNIAKIDNELEQHTLGVMVHQSEEAKLIKEYQKEIDKALKRANSYKRNFGFEEKMERKNLKSDVRLYRKQVRELQKFAHERILREKRVAVGTLIGLCRDEIAHQHWDVVIIDEAAQSFEPACWAIASYGKQLILAGDHQQLPPTLVQEFTPNTPYQTLQEKIVLAAPESVTFLDTQYRMTNEIQDFPNQYFYNNQLKVGREDKDGGKITFIDTAGCGYDEALKEQSRYNSGEISIIEKLLESVNFNSIGIISPYSQQVKTLRHTLNNFKEGDIQTIDGFQGQERELIIISLVRSNTEGQIGFLKDYRRMNVAMTRAQNQLIIIGDSATIGQDSFYNKLLHHIEEKGEYRSAWEWI